MIVANMVRLRRLLLKWLLLLLLWHLRLLLLKLNMLQLHLQLANLLRLHIVLLLLVRNDGQQRRRVNHGRDRHCQGSRFHRQWLHRHGHGH